METLLGINELCNGTSSFAEFLNIWVKFQNQLQNINIFRLQKSYKCKANMMIYEITTYFIKFQKKKKKKPV